MTTPEEKNIPTQTDRVGVYICHCGGNISDHVDVRQLAENAKKIPGVTAVHTNIFMCSDPGQELIQEDIKSGAVDRVVVASCAPHLHETTFRSAIKRAGMNPYLYDHANIREQVSWVHHGEAATAKATRLVAAAVAKTKYMEALEPIRVDAKRHATVIGAGVAGLRAAIDLSRRGIRVALVEKSPFLGGRTAKLDRLMPTGEAAETVVRHLAGEVLNDDNITVYTCTEATMCEGYVGNFRITFKRTPPENRVDFDAGVDAGTYIPFSGLFPQPVPHASESLTIDTGGIVMATGFLPYSPRKGEYGYEDHPEVITLPDFIRHTAAAASAGKKLTLNGKPIERVALVHCVGSRQIPGIDEPDEDGNVNEHCSRTCCGATLQAGIRIREQYPETHVYEYYRDIRTYGRDQEAYYERASKAGVVFFRFEPEDPPVIEQTGSGPHPLTIRVKDTLTFGEEVEAEVDLVVLSVGMVPGSIQDLVEMMKLPVGADRFLQEVHPKLRPVEVATTGMLLAGTCQAPMAVGEACAAAQAASAKAAILLTKGYVELDPFVAQVDTARCSGHGFCVDECPEGAVRLVDVDVEGQRVPRARVNPALCTGCGRCVAVCPENAIDVNGWTLQQYEAMVDAIAAA